MKNDKGKRFKEYLKSRGISIKWFWENYIYPIRKQPYSSFAAELNGYYAIAEDNLKAIDEWWEGSK